MKRIEEYIELANKAVENISYPAEPNGLYEPIRYGMAQGGKRLRPALLLAACDAAGVETEKAMKQAAAIEMFHNFTLLHDDVMDKADLRRGKPTVCNKWDDNTAILSGDTMLTLATELLVDGMEAQKAVRLLRLFNRTAIEVYEGQQYDMEFETRNDVSIDEYIHMIRLKTSVLLGCACKIGAIVGNATEKQCEALYNFAIHLGIAFQLQDDLLDVYGDPKVFGKAIGGDILNNKKTFLLINAMKLAEGDDRAELQHWLNADAPFAGEKIAAVTALYNKLGVDELCRKAIERYNASALDYLHDSGFGEEQQACFEQFDKMIMGRNK